MSSALEKLDRALKRPVPDQESKMEAAIVASMADGGPDRSMDWVRDGLRAKVPLGEGLAEAFGGPYGHPTREMRHVFRPDPKNPPMTGLRLVAKRSAQKRFMDRMRSAKDDMVEASPRIQAALQLLRDARPKRGMGPAPFGPQIGGY